MRTHSRDSEFSDFVAARQGHLRRIAYSICGDWHLAEDLVQMALTKLYVAWPRIHKRGSEEAYARQIIVRCSIDQSRKPWRRERAGMAGIEPEARTGASVEDRDSLLIALMALPEMQRKVVVLRHWLGLSVDEVAGELQVSTGTVKSHSSRGLARLNELLTSEQTQEMLT